MKNRRLISIDIETTGLDPEKCEILSIGAVVINLDTRQKEDTFYGIINHYNFYSECLDKAGMNNTVTHNALEDAQQVADLVLYKLQNN